MCVRRFVDRPVIIFLKDEKLHFHAPFRSLVLFTWNRVKLEDVRPGAHTEVVDCLNLDIIADNDKCTLID